MEANLEYYWNWIQAIFFLVTLWHWKKPQLNLKYKHTNTKIHNSLYMQKEIFVTSILSKISSLKFYEKSKI